MSFTSWLKQKLGIRSLEEDNTHLRNLISGQEKRIDERIAKLDEFTAIDADIGMRSNCTVILSGVYRGRGYVQFYEMSHTDFEHMVREFQERRKDHLIRNVDAPYGYELHGIKGSFEI